ncbi:MAG TPA: hypothetical protein VFZ09_47950 [Archangium sp.]|uniref:hypothetical protein n=1 Tax=Archangium sp. TaxID=1872627 RepID=UPI002E340621|nr:hypothetical protein [Archangium sp.]HEX5754010.1 hypothetical protein [Archangium sp.]
MSTTNLDIAHRYFRAIEQGATGEALAAFFHPEVTQIEYPNRLVPTAATRDLRALLEGAERGQKVVASQRCFSTRLPGWGNLALWGVLFFLAERVLPGLGKDESARYAFTVRQYLLGLLMPELDFRRTFAATPLSWLRLTTYFSNVSLLLLLGIHVFNQREVSYASR